MEGAWYETVLRPRLGAVDAALSNVGTPGWEPEALRRLTADITQQINSATAAGTITAGQGVEAGHLLAELVRSHGGVATERRTVNVSSTVKIRGPFGRTREVEVDRLTPKTRARMYAASIDQLNKSVAEGKVPSEAAAEIAAQLRQKYGQPDLA